MKKRLARVAGADTPVANAVRRVAIAAAFCAATAWGQTTRPATRPATKPATRPATQPATAPATAPAKSPKRIDPYVALLKDKGVEANREGLEKFLDQLHPSDAALERAAELIRQLGSAVWQQREAATRELLKMPSIPIEMLRRAEKDPDAEIRARAQHILGRRAGQTERLVHAGFRVIAAGKITGLAPGVLKAIPLCADEYLLAAGGRALAATVQAGDVDLLRRALKSDNVDIRRAAAGAITRLLGKNSAKDVYPLLDDREPSVALAAAIGLADCGDRKSLAALLRMLSADSVRVRARSAGTLRALTGKNFHFAAYGMPAERAKSAAAWKKWIDTKGDAAKLHFPLKIVGSGVGDLHGNTLIAYGYKNKVEELTPAGKVVWTCRVQGAWAAEKLPNGNVLVAAYQHNKHNKVQEIDRKGKVVWEYSVNCLGVKPLANGNVLIADYRGKRAIEVTRAKRIVWTYKTKNGCTDVQRLPNGNTLVAAWNSVEEVTLAGKVVWSWTAPGQIHGARRLENGNTLIVVFRIDRGGVPTGAVIELAPTKKVVWQYQTPAVDAFRLPNGNTLITIHNKVIEVTPAKKIIWEHAGLYYGSARR